jgi:hypothetical protein
MTASVWIILAAAVGVLVVVVAGAIVAGERDRRRRSADDAEAPAVDVSIGRMLAGPEGLDGMAQRVAASIDPLSLDRYLRDEATRAKVDGMLDVLAAQRAEATASPPEAAIARRAESERERESEPEPELEPEPEPEHEPEPEPEPSITELRLERLRAILHERGRFELKRGDEEEPTG